jgi:regulator of protease activity HflC (stomatin/prohibitin superfamily)
MSGGVKEETKGQGWHLVYPNQKVIDYPVSTETAEIAIEGGTNDGKTVVLYVQYAYHMNPEMLPHVFTKFRGRSAEDIAKSYINQLIRDHSQTQTRLNSVLGVYSQSTTKIIESIKSSLTEELAKDGIVLERFTISNVIPDEQTLITLQSIADAQNKQELLKREETNKKQEATNNLIVAEGEKAVQIVNAQAEAERQLIEANARTEANRLLTESLSQSIIQYEWIKRWDGILPTHMLGDDTGLLLSK